jgi:phage tail sheath protein FI
MPEYLAPGVYVEEVSFRTGTIEGVSTSTAAFVGPTRYGPIYGTPSVLTCLSDFEAIYGSLDPLYFGDVGSMVNYVAQGVRAFFDNGGQRLYVVRAYNATPGDTLAGVAQAALMTTTSPPSTLTWSGRYPGAAGNVTLTVTFSIGQNVLGGTASSPVARSIGAFDLVWISKVSSPPGMGGDG